MISKVLSMGPLLHYVTTCQSAISKKNKTVKANQGFVVEKIIIYLKMSMTL